MLVWRNKEQFGSKPNSLSLLSAILKRANHDVMLLDTTFIDFGYVDNTEIGTKARIFKPVDFGAMDMRKRQVDFAAWTMTRIEDFRPDVLAISALSDEIRIGWRIAELAKAWNAEVPVVWGNKSATLSPERVLENQAVDYLCIGEGVAFLPALLACLPDQAALRKLPNLAWRNEDGTVARNPLAPFCQDLDGLPWFDYSIYDTRQFYKPFDGQALRSGDHMITWGCPNRCTYCVNDFLRKLYGPGSGKYLRSYSPGRIVDELLWLAETWDLEFYKFHDEDFCLKRPDQMRELSQRYRQEVNLPFTAMANARNVTEEKAELLAAMNCASISLGFESGDEYIRREVLSRNESLQDLERATKCLNAAGIRTSSFNMLGLPFETRQSVFATIEINRRAEVLSPNSNFFFPYENTELYRISVDNGFYDPQADAVYKSDQPALTLPDIDKQELIAIRERFVLYVKMPDALRPLIERSETADSIGRMLTTELYRLYEETVLANNGTWPGDRDPRTEAARLEALAQAAGRGEPETGTQ